MSTTADRMKAAAVVEAFAFLKKHRLALDDLTGYGGEDLPNAKLPDKHSNPARVKKARAVERCWELIARLGLTAKDLDPAL